MSDEFDIQAAATVTDPLIIAALTAAGFTCLLLTLRAGKDFAVFENSPEFKDALKRFESYELKIDARKCWEAFDELNWRLGEESYEQKLVDELYVQANRE